MKLKKNTFIIIMALVLVMALAACGQKTEEVVTDDNIEKSDEPMETIVPYDDDNESSAEDENSTEHENTNDDSEDTMDGDDEMATDPNKIFTLEELSTYDGNDGRPAYVAVDGIVYDLTNSGAWKNGRHNGFTAGRDLTEEIINVSPHGVKNLEGIPIVGKLADE